MVLLTAVILSALAGLAFGQYTSSTDIQKQIVDLHNQIRREVNTTATFQLSWDADAAAEALAWVNKCQFWHPNSTADMATYRTTSKFTLGQNIYQMSSSDGVAAPWSAAIKDSWYSEIKDFNLGAPPKNGATVGHYTQLVWGTTSVVGCAYKNCGKFHFYACNYGPAGNISPNQFSPYEKGTVCGKCPNACSSGLCTNPCPVTNILGNCDTSMVYQGKTYPPLGCSPNYKDKCAATCQCKGTLLY